MSASASATVEASSSPAAEIATAIKDSFVYGIGSILTKVAGFLLLPMYTHYLSPQDYGVFEVLELSMSLLGMFLNMGITSAILRHYGLAETEAQKRKVIGTLFHFVVGASVAVCLIGFPLFRPVSTLLLGPNVPTTFLVLSFVGFLISYIANVPDTALRARGAAGTVATIDTLSSIGLLLLNIYFIAVLKTSLFGMFLGRVIINTINVLVLARWTYRELTAGMDWKLLRQAIGFGTPLILSNLSMFVLNFSDRFFLQRMQSLEVVGIYSVGYKFGYLLSAVVIWPFFMMWHARMYVIYKRPDYKELFARVFILYSVVLVFAGLCVSAFKDEVMDLMVDHRFAAGGSVIPVISLAYVLLGIGYYVQVGMYLTSRTGLLGIISGVAAVVNLVANYLLISRIGMMGAAWATVIGLAVLAVGNYHYSQRVCPLPLPAGRVLRMLAVGVGVFAASRLLPHISLPVDLLLKSLLVLLFPILLWVTRCFSDNEIATLRSLGGGAIQLLKPARVELG